MRVLVTGSEGFIGKELVRQCRGNNIDVVEFDMVHGDDIRSSDIPSDIDVLVHLAALSNVCQCLDIRECYEVNVLGTLNMIEAAKKREVKHFIFASSEWVYGELKDRGGDTRRFEGEALHLNQLENNYAVSKLISEADLKRQFCQGFCPVTIFRFGIVYGPERLSSLSAVESIFNTVRFRNKVVVGSLKTARCFVHVDDIVRGILAAISSNDSRFDIYNLTYDRPISLKEVIETSQKVLGRQVKVEEKDSMNHNVRNPCNARARALLDWTPRINLLTGLESLL